MLRLSSKVSSSKLMMTMAGTMKMMMLKMMVMPVVIRDGCGARYLSFHTCGVQRDSCGLF